MFETVNGFSNGFEGWGGEDDDFWLNRLSSFSKGQMLRYKYPISKYTMLHHTKAKPSESRFDQIEKGRLKGDNDDLDEEGLSTTEYKLISSEQRDLYTHLLVAI